MDLGFVLSSVIVFTGVVVILVIGLEAVRKKLNPGGTVTIDINNGSKVIEIEPGSTLLL